MQVDSEKGERGSDLILSPSSCIAVQFKGQLQQLLGILDANYPELSGRIQIIK